VLIPWCGILHLILLHLSPLIISKVLLLFLYDSLVPHSVNSASHLSVINFSVKTFCLEVDDLHLNFFVFLRFHIYNSLFVSFPVRTMKVYEILSFVSHFVQFKYFSR